MLVYQITFFCGGGVGHRGGGSKMVAAQRSVGCALEASSRDGEFEQDSLWSGWKAEFISEREVQHNSSEGQRL